jgi:hypothetical protein
MPKPTKPQKKPRSPPGGNLGVRLMTSVRNGVAKTIAPVGVILMPESLLSLFPKPSDLLALGPEDLAGVLLELAPDVMQNGMFQTASFTAQLFRPIGETYPSNVTVIRSVELAIAEALSWLVTQGLLVIDPGQPAQWFVLTRRAATLQNRADVEAYRKGRMLPVELLQPALAEKVWPQFLRGDHDVAVFQAFKEVEVAVRKAANGKSAGYPDDILGVPLMRKAFHPEIGPLSDMSRVTGEREAEMHLFSGAIGHAKNPASHRDVEPGAQEAARLIVFASHLLDIVQHRSKP